MNERQIPRWAMAAVALILLFSLGSLLYNSGYSSGMVTGLLVTSGEGGAMNPYLLSRMGGLHGGFGFFGFVLRIGFFLVFLAVIAKVFGVMRWKMHRKWDGDGNGGENAFSPHYQGMWEAHRAWHQAEQQAQPTGKKAEEGTASAPPTEA